MAKVIIGFLFTLLLLSLTTVFCSNSNSEAIDTTNYQEKILNSEEAWLIKYYSKKCGTCIEFEPVWLNTIKKIKKLKIGVVDIDSESGMELARNNQILNEGIPLVKLIYGKNGKGVTLVAGDFVNEKEFLNTLNTNVKKYLSKAEHMYLKEDL